MKNAKSLMGLMLLTLMASSCVSLNGQLDVKQAMSAKKKSGFLHLKTTEIKISPDLYSAELKISGDKSYTLKLEGHDTISIPIKSEKDLNTPSTGKVLISHNDINQPFDISGNIATDITESARTDDVQDCTWTVTENHCQKICNQPGSCTIECKDVPVTFSGHQEISYHYETTHRDLSIDFLKVDKPEVLASFHGTNTAIEKITDFLGACR